MGKIGFAREISLKYFFVVLEYHQQGKPQRSLFSKHWLKVQVLGVKISSVASDHQLPLRSTHTHTHSCKAVQVRAVHCSRKQLIYVRNQLSRKVAKEHTHTRHADDITFIPVAEESKLGQEFRNNMSTTWNSCLVIG